MRFLFLALLFALALLASAAPTVQSVSMSPSTVYGGLQSIGTVTISQAAPTGGFPVDLASTSVSAPVPASVTVPHGAVTVRFSSYTTVVASSVKATISAWNATSGPTVTASLTVQPVPVASVSLSPNPVVGGYGVNGVVTLGIPAPAGGVVVEISSDQTSVIPPETVTVSPSYLTAKFRVKTVEVAAQLTANVSASTGGTSAEDALTVNPPPVASLTFASSDLSPGEQTTATVTLGLPAPTGGVVVSLACDSSYFTIPATVKVPSGDHTAKFTVTASTNSTENQRGDITASTAGGSVTSPIGLIVANGLAKNCWPMPGHDTALTFQGSVAQTGTTETSIAKVPYSSGYPNSIIVGPDGSTYVHACTGNTHFYVYAVSPNGGVRWHVPVIRELDNIGDIALGADGTLFVEGTDGYTDALDSATGAVKWRLPASIGTMLNPDGTLTLYGSTASVAKVDSVTGNLIWLTQLPAESVCATAADGTVVCNTSLFNDPELVALDGSSGAIEWEKSNSAYSGLFPSIDSNGVIYLAGNSDTVYAVSPSDGTQIWQETPVTGQGSNDLVWTQVAIASNGTLYVKTQGGFVYALNSASGSVKWSSSQSAEQQFMWWFWAIDANCNVALENGAWATFVSLNQLNGSQIWSVGMDSTEPCMAIGPDGGVYTVDAGGTIWKIGGSGG